MPLLILLVLLITVIALHKAKLSERVKKILTAAHVLLILAIIFLVAVTFDVGTITGNAIDAAAAVSGIPALALTIIVSILLVGGATYVAVTRGIPNLTGMEQYYNKSKYWLGYATQRVKWSAKRKKMAKEIEVDMPPSVQATPPTDTERTEKTENKVTPPEPNTETEDKKKEDKEEKMMFGSLMRAIKNIDNKVGRIEDEVETIKETEKEEADALLLLNH